KVFEAIVAATPAKDVPVLRAEALVGAGRAHLALKAEDRAAAAWREAFDLTEFDDTLGPTVGVLLGDLLFQKAEKLPQSPAGSPPGAPGRAGTFLDAAKAYYRTTRWPAHPDAARSYFMVGEAYRLAGRTQDAAFAYRSTAERYGRDPLAPRAALAAGDAFLAC